MRLRLAAPTVLIDLGRLEELRYVRDGGDHLAIGAMTRHRDLLFNDLVKEHCGIVGWTAGSWATRPSSTAALWAARWPTATPRATCRASSRRSKGS
jgi:CO/xanthine dehydrogenase FAD-binding subunit